MTAARRLQLAAQLGCRDWAILQDLQRVRLLSGRQLERLHFAGLQTAGARGSARRRSLGRLNGSRLVTTLPRQVGGQRSGSAGLVYTLDGDGYRLLADNQPLTRRVRRPWPVGWLFVQHTLDVAELYVRLREAERLGHLSLRRFDAEPAAWHRQRSGAVLKPDTFIVSDDAGWEHHYWVEVDRGTESLPTVQRKLLGYLDAVHRGEANPLGVVPLVLVTAPDPKRLAAITRLIASLPEPAAQLFRLQTFDEAFRFDQSAGARPPP